MQVKDYVLNKVKDNVLNNELNKVLNKYKEERINQNYSNSPHPLQNLASSSFKVLQFLHLIFTISFLHGAL
jgi:hypothetical protein